MILYNKISITTRGDYKGRGNGADVPPVVKKKFEIELFL